MAKIIVDKYFLCVGYVHKDTSKLIKYVHTCESVTGTSPLLLSPVIILPFFILTVDFLKT